MRRDTLVFALAGIVFGLVVGYMSASWGQGPGPAPTVSAPSASGPAEAIPTAMFDPSEEQALVAFAERQPGDVGVRVELGNLYMDHQRWDDAIRWYREALALSPGLTNVLNELGAGLVRSGQFAEGLAAFDEVLAQDATNRNALYNRGLALRNLGRTSEAVAAWEEVLRLYPDDPQLRGLRGEIDNLQTPPAGGRP